MNQVSDTDDELIHALIQGVKRLREGDPIPPAEARTLAKVMDDAVVRIGALLRPKEIRCRRCGELN
jgi:hypothetical protein